MKLLALVQFLLMYVLMIRISAKRVWIVLTVAAISLVSGILPLSAVPGAINWNVLLMIGGTMILVDYFIDSYMPNCIADSILGKAGNVCMVTVLMSLFSGAVSAFMDNVATVLMIAPVGLAICRQLKISPVPMILSIAVSSNLQGAGGRHHLHHARRVRPYGLYGFLLVQGTAGDLLCGGTGSSCHGPDHAVAVPEGPG